jgi:hypothetical protein
MNDSFPGACSRGLQIAVSKRSVLARQGAISRPPRSRDLNHAHIWSPHCVARRLGTPSPRVSDDVARRVQAAAGRGFGVRGGPLGPTHPTHSADAQLKILATTLPIAPCSQIRRQSNRIWPRLGWLESITKAASVCPKRPGSTWRARVGKHASSRLAPHPNPLPALALMGRTTSETRGERGSAAVVFHEMCACFRSGDRGYRRAA